MLAQQAAVPDDAAVVVVAGPKTDFFAPEVDALKNYLTRAASCCSSSTRLTKPTARPLTNLIALAHDWGIEVGNNIVVDVSGMGRLTSAPTRRCRSRPAIPSHPITEHFQLITAFPLARSMTPVQGGVNGHTAQAFVETSGAQLGRDRYQEPGRPTSRRKMDDKGDKKGPVTLAAAVSGPASKPAPAKDGQAGRQRRSAETRLVAFGDSDFAANAALGIQGNRDLFMNTVGWLSQQENLISIRPKEADDRRITLTAQQESIIFCLSLLIVPGLVLLAGVQTWWRRR